MGNAEIFFYRVIDSHIFKNAKSRSSGCADQKLDNVSTQHENKILRFQIKQLNQRLSQCTLDWNTEKVAKRAIQRELDSLSTMLESIQNEENFNWSCENQSLSERIQTSSTNPFGIDRDEAESLGLFNEFLSSFFQLTQNQLDALESTLYKLSASFMICKT